MSEEVAQVAPTAARRAELARALYDAACPIRMPLMSAPGIPWSDVPEPMARSWLTLAAAVEAQLPPELAAENTRLKRVLANSDVYVRDLLVRITAQEQAIRSLRAHADATAADNAALCRLLGITEGAHPGLDLLADYQRLKQIEHAAAALMTHGGADRRQALITALEADGEEGDHDAPGL